jgi:hypothetical protein
MKKLKVISLCILSVILLAAIPSSGINNSEPLTVKEAANIAENQLLSVKEGITGISWTDNPAKVIVYIESDEYRDIVPSEIGGYETEIRITGVIKALGFIKLEITMAPQKLELLESEPIKGTKLQDTIINIHQNDVKGNARHEYWDYTVGGISVGTRRLPGSYGTLAVVTGYQNYILSCTHVLAQNLFGNHISIGTGVIQPGSAHGGGPVIGRLRKYTKIKYGGFLANYADAAIATFTNTGSSPNQVLDENDINVYYVNLKPTVPSVGKYVRKSGATTGVTENEILDNHATVIVQYGLLLPIKRALFKDVIMVDQPFLDSGDSGSFVDYNGDFVGIAFAGSYEQGIVCKAEYVVDKLNLRTAHQNMEMENLPQN